MIDRAPPPATRRSCSPSTPRCSGGASGMSAAVLAPAQIGPRTLVDGAIHPGWTWAFVRAEPSASPTWSAAMSATAPRRSPSPTTSTRSSTRPSWGDVDGCARSGTARSWSRASRRWTTPSSPPTPASTRSRCPTTEAASSTTPPPRSRSSRRSPTRSAVGSRSSATAASGAAATSSRPSRRRHRRHGRPGLPLRPGCGGRAGRRPRARLVRADITAPWPSSARPVAELDRSLLALPERSPMSVASPPVDGFDPPPRFRRPAQVEGSEDTIAQDAARFSEVGRVGPRCRLLPRPRRLGRALPQRARRARHASDPRPSAGASRSRTRRGPAPRPERATPGARSSRGTLPQEARSGDRPVPRRRWRPRSRADRGRGRAPCHRWTASASKARWSSTHGRIHVSHHAPNGSAIGAGSAPRVEQLEECTDLHARHGDPPACGRCGGGHRVADRDETGPTELPPVEVEQAAADHDAARRRGDPRVRPLGEGGDRPAGGVEGIRRWRRMPRSGVGGGPDDHRREVAVLVREDVGCRSRGTCRSTRTDCVSGPGAAPWRRR